jgi:hypothetical protein
MTLLRDKWSRVSHQKIPASPTPAPVLHTEPEWGRAAPDYAGNSAWEHGAPSKVSKLNSYRGWPTQARFWLEWDE